MTSNVNPVFELTPIIGEALLQVGDTSLVKPTSYQTIAAAAPASGRRIDQIDVKGVAATSATILRLFDYDGTNFNLLHELQLPAGSAPSSTVIPLGVHENFFTRPDIYPIILPQNSSLVATINDTQLAQEIDIKSIAQSQTPTGSGTLVNLNGSNVTAGSATAVAAAAAWTANTPMTLTANPVVLTNPVRVSLTSGSNASAASAVILGRTAAGVLQSETVTGPNAATVYTAGIYKTIYAIIPTATNAATVSAGYSTVVGSTILPIPSKVMLTSGGNDSATNFTLTGMASDGSLLSEVLAGPNAGSVQSANIYAALFTIAQSGTPAAAILAGNPPILGGFRVLARGGDLQ